MIRFSHFKILPIVCILFIIHQNAYSQEIPVPSKMMELGNFFAPGLIQISNGQEEGYWYLWGTAAASAGFFMQGSMTPNGSVKNVVGNVLFGAGSSVLGYSLYAYLKDSGQLNYSAPRETFLELLTSPFNLQNFSSVYVFPLIGITLFNISQLLFVDDEYSGLFRIRDWYAKDSVSFWGGDINPWVGTCFYLVATCVQMSGVALAEEVLFRGIVNDQVGLVSSSVLFGAVHLPNIFIENKINSKTILNVAMQTFAATCLGAILADRMAQNDGKLGEAVALHFWWNLSASMFNLLLYVANNKSEGLGKEVEPDKLAAWISPTLSGAVQLGVQIRL